MSAVAVGSSSDSRANSRTGCSIDSSDGSSADSGAGSSGIVV